MEELKTLKDMCILCAEDAVEMAEVIYLEEIRQEAIKWLDNPRTSRMNAKDFIIVFFDITEEDLKWKLPKETQGLRMERIESSLSSLLSEIRTPPSLDLFNLKVVNQNRKVYKGVLPLIYN